MGTVYEYQVHAQRKRVSMPGEGDHFKMTDSCQSGTKKKGLKCWQHGQIASQKQGNGGKGGNKVKSTTGRKTERKRGRKVKGDRKRDGYSKVSTFTHCLPRVILHPPENAALCLAVGELTFTACLLLL